MSFVDVFLRHTPATLVLCIVPINTIQNWKAEFDMWVPPSNFVDDALVLSGEVRPRDYIIYTLNENFKTMAGRAALIGMLSFNYYSQFYLNSIYHLSDKYNIDW